VAGSVDLPCKLEKRIPMQNHNGIQDGI
jgi:hypothetical protein